MNVSNSLRNVETGTYAIATQTFSAYTKDILAGKSTTHILYVKTGDMFLVIEKDPETYSRWPIKVLTEEHGPLYFSNLDAHHFLYVKCGDNLVGKSFCITGELSAPRAVFQKIITLNGGQYKTNVTKNLDYLIISKNHNSLKAQKAVEYFANVKVINEYDFLAIVG